MLVLVSGSGTTVMVGGAAGDSTDFPAAALEATVDGVVRSTPFPLASVSVDTDMCASSTAYRAFSVPVKSTPKAPPLLLEQVTGEGVACVACGGGESALWFASVVSSCTYPMETKYVRA